MKSLLKKYISVAFPSIVKFYRERRILNKMRSEPQVLQNGTCFYGIQNAKNYEPTVFSHVERLAKNYNNFVNVGANHGFYVFSFHHEFKQIVAVEALHHNIQAIAKNVEKNNLHNKVFIAPYAASEKKEVIRFFGTGSGGSLLKGFNKQYDDGVFVQAVNLDELIPLHFKDESTLYLIDVEGAEWQVLKGAKNLISSPNSVFVVEICCREFMPNEEFGQDFSSIFELFFANGYKAREIMSDGSLKDITFESVENMISSNRYEGMMVIFEQN